MTPLQLLIGEPRHCTHHAGCENRLPVMARHVSYLDIDFYALLTKAKDCTIYIDNKHDRLWCRPAEGAVQPLPQKQHARRGHT